ncbi:MAG: pilus assembly protein [Alphaproteobacteria bacterium]|nr:pilus assembly protein [Alphaproteobacteria bacterium]MBU0792400.1 pilus assembly protein [Alphaproteobacteria bacterium]MBU0877165.1 pilus assembly protein [Alphaproteobacteria bacterium]MBU1770739.1 pilus assembly protein [Alphaproteobacteria bacterium]
MRDTRGVAAAEMAMVTPLLMVIMFGIFEAGNFFWNEHIVVKAVRDGARFAGRQSFADYSCAAVTNSGVETSIKNLTRTGDAAGSGDARVSGWINDQVTVSVSCSGGTTTGIYTGRASGAPVVTVSATVPYNSLFGALGFDTAGLSVSASAQSPVMGI